MSLNKELYFWEAVKLEKGQWLGSFPRGYGVIKAVKKKYCEPGTIYLVNEEVEQVKDIFNTYAQGGYSLTSITDYINKKHNTRFTRSSFGRLLHNKFYIGIMAWKGHEFPHRYPVFIDKEVFERCQEILDKNTKYVLYKPQNIAKKDEEVIQKQTRLTKDEQSVLDKCINPIGLDDLADNIALPVTNILRILTALEDKNLIMEDEYGQWQKKL